MTRTIQSELKRAGLSKEQERRPSSFIDHAVEADYVHDIVHKKGMIFKRPKKEKRYRIRKGGEVRHVKIRATIVDTSSVGFQVLVALKQADAPMRTKQVQGALPNVNPKTVSAYLTWYSQAGIIKKTIALSKEALWSLVATDRPLEMLYADYLQHYKANKRKESVPKTNIRDDTSGMAGQLIQEDVVKTTLKDVLLDLKKLFEEGITVRIKVSLE